MTPLWALVDLHGCHWSRTVEAVQQIAKGLATCGTVKTTIDLWIWLSFLACLSLGWNTIVVFHFDTRLLQSAVSAKSTYIVTLFTKACSISSQFLNKWWLCAVWQVTCTMQLSQLSDYTIDKLSPSKRWVRVDISRYIALQIRSWSTRNVYT